MSPAPTDRLIEDYGEAQAHARATARRLRLHVRLKAVTEFGRKGYRVRLVPRPDQQFGRDREGEHYGPDGLSAPEPPL